MPPPAKRPRSSQPSSQKYKAEYTTTWPFLNKSSVSENHIRCTYCNSDFSVAHGGRNDCVRHVEGPSHIGKARQVNQNMSVKELFQTASSAPAEKHRRQVIQSEAILVSVISELNLSLSSADVLLTAIKKMCPDSKIAKGK